MYDNLNMSQLLQNHNINIAASITLLSILMHLINPLMYITTTHTNAHITMLTIILSCIIPKCTIITLSYITCIIIFKNIDINISTAFVTFAIMFALYASNHHIRNGRNANTRSKSTTITPLIILLSVYVDYLIYMENLTEYWIPICIITGIVTYYRLISRYYLLIGLLNIVTNVQSVQYVYEQYAMVALCCYVLLVVYANINFNKIRSVCMNTFILFVIVKWALLEIISVSE